MAVHTTVDLQTILPLFDLVVLPTGFPHFSSLLPHASRFFFVSRPIKCGSRTPPPNDVGFAATPTSGDASVVGTSSNRKLQKETEKMLPSVNLQKYYPIYGLQIFVINKKLESNWSINLRHHLSRFGGQDIAKPFQLRKWLLCIKTRADHINWQ